MPFLSDNVTIWHISFGETMENLLKRLPLLQCRKRLRRDVDPAPKHLANRFGKSHLGRKPEKYFFKGLFVFERCVQNFWGNSIDVDLMVF